VHVTDGEHPARLSHREEELPARAVLMVVEVAAVPAGPAVRDLLAVGGDADHADHRAEREADPVVHPDRLLVDVEDVGHGGLHCVDQLSELGDDRREATRAGTDLEQLDDQRIARLGAAHRDRPGCAVDTREVDVTDEIGFRLDLPGEAVVRLEADDRAGLHLEHWLEVGPEAPDHLVACDDVIDGSSCGLSSHS
jgi:hypothetical protein